MRNRRSFWLVLPLLAAIGLGAYFLMNDNARDRRVWARFQDALTPEQVTQIEVGHTTPIVLTAEEKGRALTLLQQARFQESNRKGRGPTAETVLTLRFADGHTEHMGFWGGDTFELSPRHLDPNSQFLIASPALGDLIQLKMQR